MAYFPAFIRLDDMDILIVGGGDIASKKLEHLLDFTSNIKVIAPNVSEYMKQMIDDNNLQYEDRIYQKTDIKNFGIVVVAIDDIPLQEEIYNESKTYPNCLCNSVDSVNYCDFIFPSYIKKDDLTIAVSTAGSSPAMAKHLKKYLQSLIPNTIGDFLKEMKNYRKTMKKGKERMEFLDKKAEDYISTWEKN
ncbi:MAG: bifunctional precorrin-2 dehydrogenase/sirohydrochlorin ferrochelatase [Epsilonproteobacteria bacterium]|nr:MAG: bifunctional precorrin-2 dehydrogenase/sirohydrochlorin ferrochelatase [Campylobacterota bacterium]